MSVTFDGSTLADGDALQRVRAGHPAAFGVLYERHLPSARRLARSLVSSPADADDIVAEVFAATFAAIRRGRGPETDFAPYLLRSIRRECHRTWRRTSPQRQTSLEVTGEDVAPEPDDDYARTDEAQVLHDAFAALPSKMRNVLWQVEVEGLSHDEIARRTGSSAPAVAQLVVRA
ncbi:MAG: sigma-70 family RNA polymerase sigma factor, partial [Ilumatobacteraceae bacterium]